MSVLSEIAESLISCNVERAKGLTKQAIESEEDPLVIINQGLIAGMNIVGARFRSGEMFIPEVLMSAKAMKECLELVKPFIPDQDLPSAGQVVMGTVKGDLHDIGKNLVAMMLESAGFRVVDLGVDVSPERFFQAVKEHKPDILGMSALLTTTMLAMKDTIDLLKEEGARDQVKIIVGGAPISEDFADEIGADGFAPNAGEATDLCKSLIGKGKI
jgi:5-methyltetrahydrofolate--homocysteine methyltransferase